MDSAAPADFPFHVEIWDLGRPYELFGAAIDKEIAVAMAQAAQRERPRQKVRLVNTPKSYGFARVDPEQLTYHLEHWRPKLTGILKTIAMTRHVIVGRASYSSAVTLLPGPLLLRQRGHVLCDSTRGDA